MAEAKKSAFWDFVEAVVIAVGLALLIRYFLFEPFIIPSGSMEPTLQPGDRIIVSKLTYRFSAPQRGEIIVFRYPPEPRTIYVKRLIGLPGETVEIRDGHLYIEGQQAAEPYLEGWPDGHDFGPVTVPPGSYFVLGDNRNNSEDSRFWGTVPRENILGKAVLLFWPPGRLELIH